MKSRGERVAFAASIADYISKSNKYDALSKYGTALEAVLLLCEDIGAAQRYLDTIGVPFDLYDGVRKDIEPALRLAWDAAWKAAIWNDYRPGAEMPSMNFDTWFASVKDRLQKSP